MGAMSTIRLLSGGAAQGLVSHLQEDFRTETGCAVDALYDAVGAIKDRFMDGDAADLIILTDAIITQMAEEGHVVPGSARVLGVVKTGIAVRKGDEDLDVSTPEALKAALKAADAIYLPDPEQSTAGEHFVKVMRKLGVYTALEDRVHIFPNGDDAMAALAKAKGKGLLGCIQTTEIRFAPGVVEAGPLPPRLELATIYTAAVTTRATNPEGAADFISKLTGPAIAPLRTGGAYEA